MATLNYLPVTPTSRIVAAARMHLFVWSIVFFFLALVVATYGTVGMVLLAQESSGIDVLIAAAIGLSVFGSITSLLAALGRSFLQARTALLQGQRERPESASRAFGVLLLLWGGACMFITSFLFKYMSGADFGIVGSIAVAFLLAAVTAYWTRRTLTAAIQELSARLPAPTTSD